MMPKHHIEYYPRFPWAILDLGVRRNVFLALAPLYSPRRTFALDLHVLAMPPAFNLSQDQTLQLNDIVTPEGMTLLLEKKMKPGRSDAHTRRTSAVLPGSREPDPVPG